MWNLQGLASSNTQNFTQRALPPQTFISTKFFFYFCFWSLTKFSNSKNFLFLKNFQNFSSKFSFSHTKVDVRKTFENAMRSQQPIGVEWRMSWMSSVVTQSLTYFLTFLSEKKVIQMRSEWRSKKLFTIGSFRVVFFGFSSHAILSCSIYTFVHPSPPCVLESKQNLMAVRCFVSAFEYEC